MKIYDSITFMCGWSEIIKINKSVHYIYWCLEYRYYTSEIVEQILIKTTSVLHTTEEIVW